jgi:hypothetical protein
MRSFVALRLFGCASLLGFVVACQQTAVDSVRSDEAFELTAAAVPAVVKSTLATTYPQATQTTWSKISPTVYQADLVSQSARLLVSIQRNGTLAEVHHKLDSVALPTAVTDYLNANYAGYTLLKAGAKRARGSQTVEGYLVLIRQNNQTYALKFDAQGVFVELTTPSGRKQHQLVAEKDLPTAVADYLKANYAGYAFRGAVARQEDGKVTGYDVFIVKDGTAYEVRFDAAGAFLNVTTGRPGKPGGPQGGGPKGTVESLTQDQLPAAIKTYLTEKQAGYAFEKAFVVKQDTTVKGYVVLFTLNGKRYAAEFDATGAFVRLRGK